MVTCRNKALDLLSRREHSYKELQQKLTTRGYPLEEIQMVLQALVNEGLQSDERFGETYVRVRASRGFGPVRIRKELQQKQMSETLVHAAIFGQDIDWFEQAQMAKCKKFGNEIPKEFTEKIKQMKFLQYRGYESSQLESCLEQGECDE